jgi:hypothetical protein
MLHFKKRNTLTNQYYWTLKPEHWSLFLLFPHFVSQSIHETNFHLSFSELKKWQTAAMIRLYYQGFR